MLISFFTHPNNVFTTPCGVLSWDACNGRRNDVRHRFGHKGPLWCPRHTGTPRRFECARLITPQVIATLKRMPRLIEPIATSLPRLTPLAKATRKARS